MRQNQIGGGGVARGGRRTWLRSRGKTMHRWGAEEAPSAGARMRHRIRGRGAWVGGRPLVAETRAIRRRA